MHARRSLLVAVLVLLNLMLIVAAYQTGRRVQKHRHEDSLYYTQASLAFGHYKSYGFIADYLEKKCYGAATSEANEMRDLQVVLLADNLRRTGNDPTLLAYIKFRDPELLKSALAGHLPELPSPEHPLTLICPEPANDGK